MKYVIRLEYVLNLEKVLCSHCSSAHLIVHVQKGVKPVTGVHLVAGFGVIVDFPESESQNFRKELETYLANAQVSARWIFHQGATHIDIFGIKTWKS